MASTLRDVGEGLVGAAGMALDLVTPFLREKRSHWGTSAQEAAARWPGDERVPTPKWSWTHGVEIGRPVEAVWPWLAQIGLQKGGFYSYQWLENLAGCGVQNADHLHPQWQAPQVGEDFRLHPDMPPLRVVEVQERAWLLVASEAPGPAAASWLFLVQPRGLGACRVISRFRSDYDDTRLADRLAYGPWLTEAIGFMMDRRMLLGIKERAEREPGLD